MDKTVPGAARRVLVVGTPRDDLAMPPEAALARDGILIFMEGDSARADAARKHFSQSDLGGRATVISGDPRRMLYKLAGPFDVIYCGDAYDAVRPTLEKLLAPGGVLIASNGR